MYTTLIDPESLIKYHKESEWLIFDTRYDLMDKNAGREAYLQGHIPGAIYVDLHDDLSRSPGTNRGRHPLPTDETINALFSELGIHSGVQVVIYDNACGSFAARLWWMLKHMQYDSVAVLDGGWQSWIDTGGSTNTFNEARLASDFHGAEPIQNVVDIEQVPESKLLIDSRDPARFRGESEPIDKAAGHIPGAINRFWKDNLLENGYFKESQVLKQEFSEILGNLPSEEAVFYCGSGVTACHNILAAAHAGLELPKLYAGSWSEWSSTLDRPVATGP